MRFEDKIKTLSSREVWNEYCGFLDLSMDEYMSIQERLLLEQIALLSKCTLGNRFFNFKAPATIDEFRATVPLTKFEDYADILLLRKSEKLPAPPVLWLETTWEGGDRPFKCAPYTREMLDTYRTNILAAMILSTARKKGSFKIRPGAKVLYSLAPLPYASGLFPGLVDPEISIHFLPSLKESQKLSFSEKCKKGFTLSLKYGMNQFYGMTSIVYNMSRSFSSLTEGQGNIGKLLGMSPAMLGRFLRAKYKCKRDGVPMKPGDVFRLDGFVCIGTDTALYKNELERLWGCRPLELAGGTETCLLGTETWKKDGLVFFPDNCFYEFIPEADTLHNLEDPSYTPRTYLMNELAAGEKYELVITTFKGGAFVRYRVGDIFRCLRSKNPQEGLDYPQFEYVDRVPSVIDIDGFTRITKREIDHVIDMAGLGVNDYIALKEYDLDNHSYVRMFVEMDGLHKRSAAIDAEVFKQHLGIYFRYYDSDYNDLKKLLGVDPLQVTILKTGTIAGFEAASGRKLSRINPSKQDIVDLVRFSGIGREVLPNG